MGTLLSNGCFVRHCYWAATLLWGKPHLGKSMPSSGALKGPSLSQHFGMMVICIVLLQVVLQAVSVAVTYMYFTNEMKQVSAHVPSAAAGYLSPLCLLACSSLKA